MIAFLSAVGFSMLFVTWTKILGTFNHKRIYITNKGLLTREASMTGRFSNVAYIQGLMKGNIQYRVATVNTR